MELIHFTGKTPLSRRVTCTSTRWTNGLWTPEHECHLGGLTCSTSYNWDARLCCLKPEFSFSDTSVLAELAPCLARAVRSEGRHLLAAACWRAVGELSTPRGGEAEGKSKPVILPRSASSA